LAIGPDGSLHVHCGNGMEKVRSEYIFPASKRLFNCNTGFAEFLGEHGCLSNLGPAPFDLPSKPRPPSKRVRGNVYIFLSLDAEPAVATVSCHALRILTVGAHAINFIPSRYSSYCPTGCSNGGVAPEFEHSNSAFDNLAAFGEPDPRIDRRPPTLPPRLLPGWWLRSIQGSFGRLPSC